MADAFEVRGSDGQITLGALGAGVVQSSAGGVLSSGTIDVGDISDLDYAAPGLTFSTANAEGSADTVIRTDATLAIFDATNPETLAVGTSAAPGSAGVAARRDHAHDITSSSSPGAAASILASGASGELTLGGLLTLNGGALLGAGQTIDLNGVDDALVLDADGDTTISSVLDDYIIFDIGGAAVLQASADGLTVTDDYWIGRGGSAGRLIFDSTPTPDEIRLADAVLDLAGIADALVLDSDGDTSISAPTDDQVDIECGGSDILVVNASGITVDGHFSISETVNTTSTYYGLNSQFSKTAGVTDQDDVFQGHRLTTTLNQSGGEVGYTVGLFNDFNQDDGNVGDASNTRYLYGMSNVLDLNSGTVYGNTRGIHLLVDQESGHTVSGSLYGMYIDVDADGTVSGTSYLMYVSGNTDFALYSASDIPSYFAGDVGIKTDSPDSALDMGAGGITFLEMTAPDAPSSANQVILFARDDGTGHCQLCARFNTGAIQELATQP